MAATVDLESDDLNLIFKTLAERGEDGKLYKKCNEYFITVFLQYLSSKLDKTENRIVVQAYGSAAEGLMCYEPCDVGDVDIMIFPNSNTLTIREEMLEYSANPLHVRIKGENHSVLQSCLVEDTPYVATSAVKNFHRAIFGLVSPSFLNIAGRTILALASLETLSPVMSAHLKNNPISPAFTLNMTQSLGTVSQICEQWDTLTSKGPENVPNFVNVADIESKSRDVIDTRYRNQVQLLKDAAQKLCSTNDCQFPQIRSVVFSQEHFKRGEKIGASLRADIESRSQNETVDRDQQFITRKKSVEDETERNTDVFSGMTSPSNDGSSVTVKPQSCSDDQWFTEDFETTSSRSAVSPLNSAQFISEKLLFKEVSKVEGTEDNIVERYSSEDQNESKSGQRLQEEESISTLKNPLSNPDDTIEEVGTLKLQMKAMYDRFVEYAFNTRSESTGNFKDIEKPQLYERVKFGMDLIPALRSRGWPKVATEWISRERTWPSPDIVDKVIQEGFHLVVKPKKNNGNPECDFRISFSHAEYILSQEMNDIQSECYRCLKRFYRAHLETQPKSLVTFHLKNILLQTLEDTGAEMWTENNRALCMMQLLGNLWEALRKKDLRHFFVRSYNLFGADYIENPKILEFLAGKVEQMIRDPILCSKQLISKQEDTRQVKMEECVSKRNASSSDSTPSANHTTGQGKFKEIPSDGDFDERRKERETTVQLLQQEATPRSSTTARHGRYGLDDVFLEITNKLIAMASNNIDCILESEESSETDLGEHVQKDNSAPTEWYNKLYIKVWNKLSKLKGWISNETVDEVLKCVLKEDNITPGNTCEEAVITLLQRIVDPSVKNPFDLNGELPCDGFSMRPALSRVVDSSHDIPLD